MENAVQQEFITAKELAARFSLRRYQVGYHLRKSGTPAKWVGPPGKGGKAFYERAAAEAAIAELIAQKQSIAERAAEIAKRAAALSGEQAGQTGQIIGVDDAAKLLGISKFVARERIKASGIQMAGWTITSDGRECYGYDRATAIKVISAPLASLESRPKIDPEKWSPPPSRGVRDNASQSKLCTPCPITALPCSMAAGCGIMDSIENGRTAGRLNAAAFCQNYRVRNSCQENVSCMTCVHMMRGSCTFDCFRIANKDFIFDSLGSTCWRRPAKRRESAVCPF